MSSSLRQWMQSKQVFDKDLLRLFPKYGVNNPEEDLCNVSEEKWAELENVLISAKRAELKDNAALLRFKKKITKITKIWKEQRKKRRNKTRPSTKKTSAAKRSSMKVKTPSSPAINDSEELKLENKRLRRELRTKNSDYNRLQQEFNAYKLQKVDEIKNRLNVLFVIPSGMRGTPAKTSWSTRALFFIKLRGTL